MPKHLRILIFVWAFIATSTNIKVALIPYIDWILAILLLTSILRYSRPKLTIIHILFLTTILCVGVISNSIVLGMVWAGKFTIIFLITSCLVTAPWPPRDAFTAFFAAIGVNALLVVLGWFGFETISGVAGTYGRSATALNYPGSLWRVGISCLFYFSYLMCICPKLRVYHGIAAIVCIALIYADGSRTGMLAVGCLPIAICLAGIKDHLYWIPYTGIILLVSLVVILPSFDWSDILYTDNPLARWANLINESGSFWDKLQVLAPDRYEMNQKTIDLIKTHPLLGNGLRSASLEGELVTNEVIQVVTHNGYLQVWADIGLLGFISFIFIVFAWLSFFNILILTPSISDAIERTTLYNAVFVLFVFSLCLLFHPISTEWSEWILFTVPFTILARALSGRSIMPNEKFTHAEQFAVSRNHAC
jgi:O-antigen ligase